MLFAQHVQTEIWLWQCRNGDAMQQPRCHSRTDNKLVVHMYKKTPKTGKCSCNCWCQRLARDFCREPGATILAAACRKKSEASVMLQATVGARRGAPDGNPA